MTKTQSTIASVSILIGCSVYSLAHAEPVRGVNPADIDNRFDVIVKHIKLATTGHTDSVTLKYDYKLNNNWGLNFELPVYTKISASNFERTGNGDLFMRTRWIMPIDIGSYGVSAEIVLPTAGKDELGTGRYQFNVGGLIVYPVSPHLLTAGVIKQSTSVAGDHDRDKISNTEIRFIPVFILSDGWAISGELRQTWEHKSDQDWQRIEVSLNKQFDIHWAGVLSTSRDFGDRKDHGAALIAMKYFF
ncbi:MAG: hypothetical protein RR884_09785 [Acinetobacter sp.]